ncbi:unnamed protein product, partial [Prorocentrum cordatum]
RFAWRGLLAPALPRPRGHMKAKKRKRRAAGAEGAPGAPADGKSGAAAGDATDEAAAAGAGGAPPGGGLQIFGSGGGGAGGAAARPAPAAAASAERSRAPVAASFAQLGVAPWLVSACDKMDMRHPTEIQSLTIPPVLAGKNVAGNAKTGSGKTACYCLPALHHLSKDPYGVFILVLIPVRELAFQIAESFRALGRSIGVTVAEVVGGREMLAQSAMILERRHAIVATPGRLADLLRGDPALSRAMSRLHTLVLDEADRLLTQPFEEPLAEILAAVPRKRQTLLFSATMTKSIEQLRQRLASGGPAGELLLLDANPNDETLDTLTQQYIFVPDSVQICYLHYLLKEHFPEASCIVFAPTLELCQMLTTMLDLLHFSVVGLHSLQSMRHRQASLARFRAGRSRILVATDVASRGLDIPKALGTGRSLPASTGPGRAAPRPRDGPGHDRYTCGPFPFCPSSPSARLWCALGSIRIAPLHARGLRVRPSDDR